MTALNFAILDSGVCVVMDSLVTADNGKPSFFTSKALPVPHLNGLLCGTGTQIFFHRWALRVMGGIVAFDISHLDEFAPECLRQVWAEMSDEQRDVGTSTIYHFGYDRGEDAFIGYAYRSTNNFESEELAAGVHTKPPYRGELPMASFPHDFIAVCHAQRAEQETFPLGDRVFIGGHLAAYTIHRQLIEGGEPEVIVSVQTVHEFDDFDEMYVDCLDGCDGGID